MKKIIIIFSLLYIFSSLQIYSQEFDLLKDYVPGQSIKYQFFRNASPSDFLNDTVSTITIFNGTFRVYIDSVTFNTTDSIRTYHLSIHKVGTQIVTTSIKTISNRNIDTLYARSIKEHLNESYKNASNRISGWIFPDSVNQSPRCPYDSSVYYPYSYYYRFYSFPSADTFDVSEDSLTLTNVATDCLDVGFTSKFIIDGKAGTIKRITSLFNFFSWSYTDTYTKYEVSDVTINSQVPSLCSLDPNYPNPFNPTTNIRFQIAESGLVTLKVYNILGKEIAVLINEEKPASEYSIKFDATGLPSGVYFYQLQAGDYIKTNKMILLK